MLLHTSDAMRSMRAWLHTIFWTDISAPRAAFVTELIAHVLILLGQVHQIPSSAPPSSGLGPDSPRQAPWPRRLWWQVNDAQVNHTARSAAMPAPMPS